MLAVWPVAVSKPLVQPHVQPPEDGETAPVKLIRWGCPPLVLFTAVNDAVTVGHAGEFTVIVAWSVSVWPRLSVTVRVTTYVPGFR